jgi:hypothetical protein
MDRRPIRNVVYYEYTSDTIEYHVDLDAFVVARGVIYSSQHPHHLSLMVVATEGELGADRYTIEETISGSRRLLDRLIDEHQTIIDHLTASVLWVFNTAGQRIS